MHLSQFDANTGSPRSEDPARSLIYSFQLAGNWSGEMVPVIADINSISGICPKNVKGPECQKMHFTKD